MKFIWWLRLEGGMMWCRAFHFSYWIDTNSTLANRNPRVHEVNPRTMLTCQLCYRVHTVKILWAVRPGGVVERRSFR